MESPIARCPRCGEAVADVEFVASIEDEVACTACDYRFILDDGIAEAALRASAEQPERKFDGVLDDWPDKSGRS